MFIFRFVDIYKPVTLSMSIYIFITMFSLNLLAPNGYFPNSIDIGSALHPSPHPFPPKKTMAVACRLCLLT
jgi:hypothetical protein